MIWSQGRILSWNTSYFSLRRVKILIILSVSNVYLLQGRKLARERAHNGAVKREGVKILENESHQSKENKKSWI